MGIFPDKLAHRLRILSARIKLDTIDEDQYMKLGNP